MTRGELEELFWGKILRDEGCSNKERRRDLLKALFSGHAFRIAELSDTSGLTEMAVYNFLNAMSKKGWVRKAARGRYEMIPEKRKQLAALLQQPFLMPAPKRESYPEVTLSVDGKKVTIFFKSKADLTLAVVPSKKGKK
jgi:transposase